MSSSTVRLLGHFDCICTVFHFINLSVLTYSFMHAHTRRDQGVPWLMSCCLTCLHSNKIDYFTSTFLEKFITQYFCKHRLHCSLKWIYGFAVPALLSIWHTVSPLYQPPTTDDMLKSARVHPNVSCFDRCSLASLITHCFPSSRSGRLECCYGNSWPAAPRHTPTWTPSTSRSSFYRDEDSCSPSFARTPCKHTVAHTSFIQHTGGVGINKPYNRGPLLTTRRLIQAVAGHQNSRPTRPCMTTWDWHTLTPNPACTIWVNLQTFFTHGRLISSQWCCE